MMKITKPYERDVYYYETDRMGIVHHSNYIKWLEEARIDFMEQVGYPFKKIEDEGLMIPVLSVSCEYRKPMKFGDTFIVRIIPEIFNGLKFSMKYEILNKATKQVHSYAQSSHCFVNEDMKPVLIRKSNEEVYETFKQYFPKKNKKAS